VSELFVVASALKYRGIASHSPADLRVNSIATVDAAVAQPPASPQLVIASDIAAPTAWSLPKWR
jgi:hypothetical protein